MEIENKPKKALFHGFPDEDNVQIKNILSGIERTFLPIGSEIGRYRIIKEIDRGGMAVVYKAVQKDLDRIVALKVLPANITINDSFVDRFLAEAHSVAMLRHPNIVTIYEVSVEQNIYFLAMDYIPGTNLFYYLNQQKPKVVTVLEIVRKLSDALQYAHEQKILHRDLKLNNVIMRENNEPVLIDFGLAKVIGSEDSHLTRTGEIIGSPAYMAPERIFGKGLDARSDICSLGIMLYEMLTFKNPYLDPRSMVQTTKNVVEATPVPPRNQVPWLPIEIESITLKAMRGDPDERYQTMKEFGEDIQRYQKGEPIHARPPSLLSEIRRFFKKHWAPVTISVIVVFFSLIVALIIHVQSQKEQSRWQLAFNEPFSTDDALNDWYVFPDKKCIDQQAGVWSILDSALYVESNGFSFIRLERSFIRDIRVECDIRSGLKDFFNGGFFICGSHPDTGYAFYVHKGSAAINATTYPGSSFLFYDYNPVEFPVDSLYHAIIEKKDNIISFWLNDILVSRIYDFFPTLGREHQKLGFFVNGSLISFDNLKIYRRAVPRLARPTIIADRFWEQGDFETALLEYKEVLLDLSRSDLARHIKYKMTDCLIRLKRYDEARNLLHEVELLKKLTEQDKARVLFLYAMLQATSGVAPDYNTPLYTLADFFPATPENKSVAAYMVMETNRLVMLDELDSAEKHIAKLAGKYPENLRHFGTTCCAILQKHLAHGNWKKAQEVEKNLFALFKKDEETFFKGKILSAERYLSRMEKQKGIEALNQCLASSQPTVAKWEAWMDLAEVYEYEHSYDDAYTIYTKVSNDCSKNLPVALIARIRAAEIAFKLFQDDPGKNLKMVMDGRHVFAEPRLIAQLYLNMIDADSFIRQWQILNPDNPWYLYCFAQKALLDSDNDKAYQCFRILKYRIPPHSWQYFRVSNCMDEVLRTKNFQKRQ